MWHKRLAKMEGQTHHLDWSVPFSLGRWFSHMGLLWLGFPWLILLFWQLNNSILGFLQFCSFLCWPLVSPSHLKSGEHTVRIHFSSPHQQVVYTDINLVLIRWPSASRIRSNLWKYQNSYHNQKYTFKNKTVSFKTCWNYLAFAHSNNLRCCGNSQHLGQRRIIKEVVRALRWLS